MNRDRNNNGLSNQGYFERALFVVGPQNSGKSYQIRSMYRDFRLGNWGNPLPNGRRPGKIHLSNERKLFIRIMSPQESGDNWKKFINKMPKAKLNERWNYVCAMQTDPINMDTNPTNKMPPLIDCISKFMHAFNPERVRLCFLSPVYYGMSVPGNILNNTIASLLRLDDRIECCNLNAKEKGINHGLFLADFFDFT